MPGAHHPDPPVLSTSSIGRPGYGFCSSSISTSPYPFFGCEEVEFDDSGLAGYSTSEGSPTCASSQSSPYGGDRPAEPVITSNRSPTSLLGSSELAGFTPPTNGNLLFTLRSYDRTLPAEPATPGGYSTSPSPGSSHSSSELSSLPSSELSSLPSSELSSLPSSELSSLLSSPSSLLASASSSGFFPGPAASAGLPSTQDNNNLQPSSKRGPKLDTKGINTSEALPGSPVLPKSIQDRTPETYSRVPNRPHLFIKTREYFPGKLMQCIISSLPDPHCHYNALTGR